eukprot:EG_transcript_17460
MASSLAPAILRTGRTIPRIGLGVYRSEPGQETYQAVLTALRLGYRHIDTAQLYANEEDVGRAVADSGVPREQVFITTKLWLDKFGYQNAVAAIKESLRKLRTPYVDLLLLHAPGPADVRAETWQALEELQAQGLLRDIGVSNFGIPHLEKLRLTAHVQPVVNQIELHPWLQRRDLVAYCHAQGIVVQAYSPLAKGKKLNDPTLCAVAQRHGVSPAQVLVAYGLAHGWVTLPKSVDPGRIRQNLEAGALRLTAEDLQRLDALDAYFVTGWDPVATAPV